ncbi:Cyclin-dependent kinase inhibitor [Arabidopsis thaliana x Arabidopsis arenosa]|nr:Cyclin-dependent kinase inhibitor [Arabidopsis thaliana x Arabidopsis arenosa]
MSERKRELAEEASSTSFSPLKKTKLNDSSDSSPDSHDVIVFAVSSSSVASSAALASDECSVTIGGEESDQSSSISSGCFTSESKEIAKNSSSFGVDLEDHQIETETETSTFITSNFRFIIFLFPPPQIRRSIDFILLGDFFSVFYGRKETSPVSEGLGETTTEMESSSATKRKQPGVRKTPTAAEIEDLFSELESQDDKKKQFIEK